MAKRVQVPKSGNVVRRPMPAKKSSGSPMLLWAILGVSILVVVALIVLQSQALNRPVQVSGQASAGLTWGPANAKVRIVEYSDFGCSYCRVFAQGQGKQLRAEYEAGGQVRFEFQHFIIEGPATAGAANAAECAADQGRFWDYHDLLFAQQGKGSDPFNKATLKQLAGQLGLDTQTFNSCVDTDQHLEKVYTSANQGKALGVQATPTFFINGQKAEGAIPYAQLKILVDSAIAAAK